MNSRYFFFKEIFLFIKFMTFFFSKLIFSYCLNKQMSVYVLNAIVCYNVLCAIKYGLLSDRYFIIFKK